MLTSRSSADEKHWVSGKVSGTVYHGSKELQDLMGDAYRMTQLSNPLHSDVFNNTRQMEAEVVGMLCPLYGARCGSMTSGGTESILLACLAHRNRAIDSRGVFGPLSREKAAGFNVVAPVTCHAAFDKASQYLSFELRKCRSIKADGRVDVEEMRRLIDGNTIMIVGSTPNYPNGAFDPIPELSELALEKGVGLHVDCCLGI